MTNDPNEIKRCSALFAITSMEDLVAGGWGGGGVEQGTQGSVFQFATEKCYSKYL